MRIGIDLDDVVQECIEPIVYLYNKMMSPEQVEMRDIKGWALHDYMPALKDQEGTNALIALYAKAGGFLKAPAVPEALDTIKALEELGNEIFYITARDLRGEADTREWFKTNGLDDNNLRFSRTKGYDAAELGLDVFVDDAIHNLDHVKMYHKGCKTLLYRRPWNDEAVISTRHEPMMNWKHGRQILKDMQSHPRASSLEALPDMYARAKYLRDQGFITGGKF